jgi:chorismate-pyruvate lyase
MIGGDREPAGACGLFFAVEPDASMISRRYRILIDEKPVILITEKFPVDRFS